MFASCFFASYDILPKYFRDIVISFFCVVVESCAFLMNNSFKNL